MAGPAVGAFTYLLKRAFDGGEHSFVRNLEATSDTQWHAIVAGQPFGRSIGEIAWHTVAGKHLYWDHAFGSRTLTGDYVDLNDPARSMRDVLEYGRRWNEKWVASIAALDDGDLEAPTTAHWGDVLSTRRVIAAVIEHDIYHAGEINHLRALMDGSDHPPSG